MMIDPDLVVMVILAAVVILPGVGASLYLHVKAARWKLPAPRGRLLRLRQRRQ